MWDADDDKLEIHANTSYVSKPKPGFSLDDAFSEDDGGLDVALEFNPAAIRAALARTLAASESENQNGIDDDDDGRSTSVGVSHRTSNHDRNGSVEVEDPDASVSTLDINALPPHVPGRAPGEWSRSTSRSYGYEYSQDRRDSAPDAESLENFSRISLSDSVHDLESVEISLEPSEEAVVSEKDEGGDTEGEDEGLFHAVHIDLSKGGKPRVEEVAAVLPERPSPHTPERDGTQTPSPKHPPPPLLPSTSNTNHSAYNPPPTSTPMSEVFPNHQTQSQSVPEFPSAEGKYSPNEPDRIPPNSAGIMLSAGPLVSPSSTTTPGSLPAVNSTASPRNSVHSESSRRGHRPSRSVGPSALDKVISKTRPNFLPPKPKVEDLKHMADWEEMMKQSRVIGEFRFDSLVWFLSFFLALWEDSSVLTFCSVLFCSV
jgi:hypothetical protein